MKSEKTISASTETQNFPLDQLYLSDLNPRQSIDTGGITALAASIKACGLIQSLAGLVDAEGKVGIVAGGRRLRALQELAAAGETVAEVPVRLAPDAETAATWARTENVAREALHPADEIRAYGQMKESGADIAKIASAFAVTEFHVIRRLKLAALPCPVLDALKAGEINLTAAEHFTLARSEEDALAALEGVREGRFRFTDEIKRHFTKGGVTLADRRMQAISLETYEAAGGTLTRDLFSKTVILHDEALIDRLLAERLDQILQAHIEEGWAWGESVAESNAYFFCQERKAKRCYPVEGVLTEEEAEEYDRLAELDEADALDDEGKARFADLAGIQKGDYTDAQRRVAGVLVFQDYSGDIIVSKGIILPEHRKAACESGVLSDSEEPTRQKEERTFSGALEADLKAIDLAAVQTALLAKPELVLDILAFALSAESGDYPRIMGVRFDREPNCPDKDTGFTLDPRLAEPEGHHPAPVSMAEAFKVFRAKGKAARNAEITRHLAAALSFRGGVSQGTDKTLYDALVEETKADMRSVWRPTAEGFFSRVKGAYLDALYCQLFGLSPTAPAAAAFAKMKKGEKAEWLEAAFADPENIKDADAESIARIKAWRPTEY